MDKDKYVGLVSAAQAGDKEAIDQLFNTFYGDVYYFALKTVKDDEVAQDITQETFVEIINTIGDLKEPAAFVSWMKQITYHQCTRYFRKKKDVIVDENEEGYSVFDTVEEENEEFLPDEALDRKDLKETILSMLNTLSPEQRSATILYYFDELSVKDIAEIQKVSEGTVKSRLNYARKALKDSVTSYEQKTGVMLHSVPMLQLAKWAVSGELSSFVAPEPAKNIAEKVSSCGSVPVTAVRFSPYVPTPAPVKSGLSLGAIIAIVGGALAVLATIATIVIIAASNFGKNIIPDFPSRPSNSTHQSSSDYGGSSYNSGIGSNSNTSSKNQAKWDEYIENFVPSSLNTTELYIGDSHSPNAAVWVQGGNEDRVYSDNTDVVTVSPYGKVTAVGEGEAHVVIKGLGNMHEVYLYKVYSESPEADLSNLPELHSKDFATLIENFGESSLNTHTLKVGDTFSPTESVWVMNGYEEYCHTSDPSVAAISPYGKVTAVSRGTAYIVVESPVGNGSMYGIHKIIVK